MSGKTGGAGGGGKQDSRKKGKVKGGGRNQELERRSAPKNMKPWSTPKRDKLPSMDRHARLNNRRAASGL
jgi:hypothetical protein